MALDNLALNADRCTSRGEVVRDYISFTANGTSAPTSYAGENLASVTWSATGKWIVTFRECGTELVGFSAGSVASGDVTVSIDALSLSAKTVEVWGKVAGAASNAVGKIYLEFVWKKTGAI